MAAQSAALARAVGYTSAGTVEWLCDETGNFYFLEMNTRLQVEHPVTEMITGVDLVEHMLEVASGLPLPKDLVDAANNSEDGMVPRKGWAVEARIYAEDPFRGFLPSTGPLLSYQEPSTSSVNLQEEGVVIRCDTGVVEGTDISMYYDPMISKLISFAPTRTSAIAGLVAAVDRYVIRGVENNAPFVAAVCRTEAFRKGDTPTSFISAHYPDGFGGVELDEDETLSLVVSAAAISSDLRYALDRPPLPLSDDKVYGEENAVVTVGGIFGDSYAVTLLLEDFATVTKIVEGERTGEPITVALGDVVVEPNTVIATVEAGGKTRVIQVHGSDASDVLTLQMSGKIVDVAVRSLQEYALSKHLLPPPLVDTSLKVLSPMPGRLVTVAVEVGDAVEHGQELCVLEAMKMQNVLRSERKGIVKTVNGVPGGAVKVDEVIVEFEE